MNYSVELAPNFKKEAKRLAKKYPSLKDDLKELFKELKKNPTLGTPLGNDVYKIRLAIASKNKGKSGGARVLSLILITQTTVLLFSIYNKGELDTVSESRIKKLLENL